MQYLPLFIAKWIITQYFHGENKKKKPTTLQSETNILGSYIRQRRKNIFSF